MNRSLLAPIVILASNIAAVSFAAEADPATKQLQVYPKNFARQHIGANLFLFNATTQAFTPTEAGAAWLDDDINTGSPAQTGKQHYLVALPEPEVITNCSISAPGITGKVTIYAGDEPSAPGAKSWTALAKDVSLETINQKKLAKPFSRLAKYVLLETDVTEAAPIYSLYMYGERPSVSFQLVKREKPIDTKAIFGPYVNDLTAISTAGLYSGGRVAFSTDMGNYTAWQRVIDDNPESSITLLSSTDQAGMILTYHSSQPVTRLSVLSGNAAKGKLEVFVVPTVPGSPAVAAVAPEPVTDGVQQVSNTKPAAEPAKPATITTPVPLEGLTPAATLVFDGSTPRLSQDLTGAEGTALLMRWTPDTAGEPLVLSELNSFNGFSLADYALALSPDAVAELAKDSSKDGKTFKDGKGLEPVGEGPEEGLEPVGELFPRANPFLPPALGFPPPLPPTTEPLSQ